MKLCCYTPYDNRKKKCVKCKKKLIKSSKKNLIETLPKDILEYIIQLYLKSKNMFFYSNLSLVSKYFSYNFNILYKSFKYVQYKNFTNLKKTIYYVTSKKYNIKFAKLYFSNSQRNFNLLFGEENMELSKHKIKLYNLSKFNEVSNLSHFDFIII